MFRGDFARTETITVLSPRAGLVMNPDARVQYRGVQIGKVSSIELLPGEQAAIHLAIDADRLDVIPANVNVNIASTTVFGAKFVQLSPPDEPTPDSVHPGQVLGADHVMVEVNTIFGQLVSVLSSIQPEKLNETLGAIATAMNGRGHQFGQTLSDLNSILGELNPSLSSLNHDLAVAPGSVRDIRRRHAGPARRCTQVAPQSAGRSWSGNAISTPSWSVRPASPRSEIRCSTRTGSPSPTCCDCWSPPPTSPTSTTRR